MNVNSLRNKTVDVEELMRNKVDIFPNRQFMIHGYKLYERDRNKLGGGVIFYIIDNISCKAVKLEGVSDDSEIIVVRCAIWCHLYNLKDVKNTHGGVSIWVKLQAVTILIESSIKTWKWLCIGRYKPPSQNDFLDNLSLILNKQTCKYDNIMLMRDFNVTFENNLE